MAHTAQHLQTTMKTQSRPAPGPSVLRRAATALIAVLVGVLAMVSVPTTAQAAYLRGVVKDVTVTSTAVPLRVGDPVTVTVSWSVPESAAAGDTFSVEALKRSLLSNVTGTVVARSAGGEDLATCLVTASTTECTLLVDGASHPGASGTFSFQSAFTTTVDPGRVPFVHAKMLYSASLPGGVVGPFTPDEPRTLELTKAVDGPAPSGDFTFSLACTQDSAALEGFPQTIALAAGETTRIRSLPVGSTCEITETNSLGAESVTYSGPSTFTVAEDSPAVIAVTATNHFALPPVTTVEVGGLTVTKTVAGDGEVPAATSFSVLYSYSADGLVVTDTLPVPLGGTATLDDLPVGTVVTLSEPVVPDVADVTWGDPAFTVIGSAGAPATTVDVTVAAGSMVAVNLTNTAVKTAVTTAVTVPPVVTPPITTPTITPETPSPATTPETPAPVTPRVSGVLSAHGTQLPTTHAAPVRTQSLATTGASVFTAALVAAGLTVGGAALVGSRRRRAGQN